MLAVIESELNVEFLKIRHDISCVFNKREEGQDGCNAKFIYICVSNP